MSLIYKILSSTVWEQAVLAGVFHGAGIDLDDGFIHFSTAGQMRETAAKHFGGQADLVLVAVKSAQLGAALRYEVSRGGDLFPHLYAPLNMSDVAFVAPLPLGPNGFHLFPEEAL